MTNSVIGITIAFHQAVVTTQITGLGMLAYRAFEIQAAKVVTGSQRRTPLVYYKSNEAFIAAIKINCPYLPTGKPENFSRHILNV